MHHSDTDIRSRLLAARLPAMPQVLLKLLEHCQSEAAGMAELAELIAKDPGIASKIFAVANSSAYHRSGAKLGLEQSLSAIGTDMVKTLVISESVFQIFNNFSHTDATDLRRFWKHSLSAAVIARDIATRMRYPHVEEAYLAGLLHDVGRLALLAAAPREYAASFQSPDDASLCAVEQRTLQLTHAEAGAWLIERWQLDSFLADSILYHHESTQRVSGAHPLIRIVMLAHLLSHHDAGDANVIAAGILCGLDADALADISGSAADQVRQAADHLGIDLATADDLPSPVAVMPEKAPDAARERLSEEVRNMVLTSSAGRTFATPRSEDALLETVIRSARILFGFDDAILLQTSGNGQSLVGCTVGAHRQRLAEFAVSLQGESAATPVAQAAIGLRPAYVERAGKLLAVGEEQLLRMLGTEALVVLPLISGARCRAVLVGGVGASQLADLQRRERFLQAFAVQASSAMAAVDAGRAENAAQLASVAHNYREASLRVAHEVNNPLSIIKNYLSILDSKLLRQEPVLGELSILNEEIDRVGQIVGGLADAQLAARPSGQCTTNVNEVIRSVVRLFEKTQYVPALVRIGSLVEDQPGAVAAAADPLKQILMNLVKNAIEAMPRGGEIEVANCGHLNRDGRVFLELSVRDTGPGIPADILAVLFTPGHTTKAGAHRGRGLAIVQDLVRQVDGVITCRSTRSGTSFEILLPVPAPVLIPGATTGEPTAAMGTARSGSIAARTGAGRSPMLDSL